MLHSTHARPNPLYIMAKPPPDIQAQITALPRNDPSRGPHLLHVTLISLYDLHYAPPDWLPTTIAALDSSPRRLSRSISTASKTARR